jgi:hypothetical protein
MATTLVEIDVHGAESMARHFREVGDHMMDLAPELERVIDLMEAEHERHFAKCRGRYVLTGATKASLTHSTAPGAVREVGPDRLDFGTDVWYAHFLTKAPKDPWSGQVPKKNRPDLRSAVVVFPKSAKSQIADMLMGYIAEPYG